MLSTFARSALRLSRPVQARALSATHQTIDPTFLSHAMAKQAETGMYFRSINLDELQFKADEESGQPLIVFPDGSESKHLMHMTPISVTGSCFFGAHGNLGYSKTFGSRKIEISDPADAAFEISLSDKDPVTLSSGYSEMTDYLDWLNTFTDKFAKHLAENIESYPDLAKKFSFMKDSSSEILFEAIRASFPPLDREWTSPEQEIVRFLNLKQNVYVRRTQELEPRAFTDVDKEVANELSRAILPVYNEAGELIHVKDQFIRSGDMVTCTLLLTPSVYNVAGNIGASMRRRMYNVTRVFAKQKTPHANRKLGPLGNLEE